MSNELKKAESKNTNLTFQKAAESYVDMKRNVLSPRTIKKYSATTGRLPEWFNELAASDISQIEINRLVNELSKTKSPKTVRNYHGFISAVLGTFNPGLKISPLFHKRPRMSLICPPERMLSVYWKRLRIRHMKSLLLWLAMV